MSNYWPVIMWCDDVDGGNKLHYTPSFAHIEFGYKGKPFATYEEAWWTAWKLIQRQDGNINGIPAFLPRVVYQPHFPVPKDKDAKWGMWVDRIWLGEDPDSG